MLVTGGTLGGVVGYCALDEDFRRTVEENLPGSGDILNAILGEKTPLKPPTPLPPPPSKLRIKSPIVETQAKEEPKIETKPKEESKPLEASVATKSEEPKPLEASVVTKHEESKPLEASVETKLEEPEPLEASVETKTAELQPLEASVVTKLEEPEPLEASTVTKQEEPEPLEASVVTKPEEPLEAPLVTEPVVEVQDQIPAPAPVETESAEAAAVISPPSSPPPPVETETIPEVEKADKTEEAPASVPEAVEVTETTVEAPVEAKEEKEELTPPPFEPNHDIENSSLELMLDELCNEMEDVVKAAVEDFSVAAGAVSNHVSIMEKVLESNVSVKDETAWNEMFAAARNKSDKNKFAELSNKKALGAIANVTESVKAGRNNKITATNPKLIAAEEAVNKASYQLDQARVKISSIQNEAKIMENYRDIVEAGRQEFQKEIASIMPDVKLGEQNSKLTEEELNMFITHAYKKVLFLQQELAKTQTVEQERFRKALEKQRLDTTSLAVEQLEAELEKQVRRSRPNNVENLKVVGV